MVVAITNNNNTTATNSGDNNFNTPTSSQGNSSLNNNNDAIALRFRQRKISLKQKLRIYKYLDFQRNNKRKNEKDDSNLTHDTYSTTTSTSPSGYENVDGKSIRAEKNDKNYNDDDNADDANYTNNNNNNNNNEDDEDKFLSNNNNNINLTNNSHHIPIPIQSVFEPSVSLSAEHKEALSVETGVEKHEEKEVHLKKILQSNNQLQHQYIPTPDASKKWNEYKDFYKGNYNYPTSYIVSSATLEDYCGVEYLMDERDDLFLKNELNNNMNEDEFEFFCQIFEEIVNETQPYLSVDPSSILSFENIKKIIELKIQNNSQVLSSTISTSSLSSSSNTGISFKIKEDLIQKTGFNKSTFKLLWDSPMTMNIFINYENNGKKILNIIEKYGEKLYNHWKDRKLEKNGESIQPQLKFEKNGEKNENDPYICFRRRESRQTRKTRKMDQSNSQKLHILLNQLEKSNEMSLLISKREKLNMDFLKNFERIFNDRTTLKVLKRKSNVIDNSPDDGLVDSSIITKKKQKIVCDFEERRLLHFKSMEEQFIRENNLSSTLNLKKKKLLNGNNTTNTSGGNDDGSNSSKNKSNGKNRKKNSSDSSKQQSSSQKREDQVLQQQAQSKQNKQAGLNAIGGSSSSTDNNKDSSSKSINQKNLNQQKQQKKQRQKQNQQGQLDQPQTPESNIYIKLNNSNIPDIDLPNVSKFLSDKETRSRKYLQDALNRKLAEDKKDNFFNLGENTLNPTIELNLPTYLADPSNALNSSISSSSFEFSRSYYNPFFDKDLKADSNYTTSSAVTAATPSTPTRSSFISNQYGENSNGFNHSQSNASTTTNNKTGIINMEKIKGHVVALKTNGDVLKPSDMDNQNKFMEILQPEVYDLFDNGNDQHHQNEVHTRELSFQLRKRTGRFGYQYLDKRYNSNNQYSEGNIDPLNDFFDFNAMEEQESCGTNTVVKPNTEEPISRNCVNVYDSELDKYVRSEDRWKFDVDHNIFGKSLIEEPADLNKISKETQVIRFGTMLWAKAYEQSRESLLKYRKEFYNKVTKYKQQQVRKHKILQQQFAQQLLQQRAMQQQALQQQQNLQKNQNGNGISSTNKSTTKGTGSTKKTGPRKQATPRKKTAKNTTSSPKQNGTSKKEKVSKVTTPSKPDSKSTPVKTGVTVPVSAASSPPTERTTPKPNSVH